VLAEGAGCHLEEHQRGHRRDPCVLWTRPLPGRKVRPHRLQCRCHRCPGLHCLRPLQGGQSQEERCWRRSQPRNVPGPHD
ncbi:unnamed protein product, partial [Symbiodinium necroappetens]